MQTAALEKARKTECFIFDVDGVLTDRGIYIGEKGELFKPFNGHDGLGIKLWHGEGKKSAVITGRKSEMVRMRAETLGVTAIWQGNPDKRQAYNELKEKFGLQDEQIAYIGDDLIDLPIMKQVGFSVAVADAVSEVKEIADYVTNISGGHGAVREAIEFVLKAQGRWDNIIKNYLE